MTYIIILNEILIVLFYCLLSLTILSLLMFTETLLNEEKNKLRQALFSLKRMFQVC